MESISAGSEWTALLPGFIVAGIGIGLANPTIAGAALQVVDPARTGMASGISNTRRIARLGCGRRRARGSAPASRRRHLAAAGFDGKEIAVGGELVGHARGGGEPALARVAEPAFVSGLQLVLLAGFATVAVGSVAAAVLVRKRVEAPEPSLEPAS